MWWAGRQAGNLESGSLCPISACLLGGGEGASLQQMSFRPQESKALLCMARACNCFYTLLQCLPGWLKYSWELG